MCAIGRPTFAFRILKIYFVLFMLLSCWQMKMNVLVQKYYYIITAILLQRNEIDLIYYRVCIKLQAICV